jgi:hypothetical protein
MLWDDVEIPVLPSDNLHHCGCKENPAFYNIEKIIVPVPE